MELNDYSLWAAPVGLAIATVELIRHRRLLPLLLGIAGAPLGAPRRTCGVGVVRGSPLGFDFGSEFEGYDWVIGFASVGGLIGALAGVWLSMRRHRRDLAHPIRQDPR